ncbi:MAG: acetyltransferase [Gammaproteobacteria bacterium]|nr:acetyltransferase [Gammaproteobacteria bacterium]
MKRLAIYGAGGHAKVVADIAVATSEWEQINMFDNSWPDRKINGHWDIVGNEDSFYSSIQNYDGVVVALGDNQLRLNIIHNLINLNAPLVSLIHPTAEISMFATLMAGCVVSAKAVVNVDVGIGYACIINTAATVDHDCNIDDGVHICPGSNLAGNVKIGRRSWIGIGAAIKQNITIGSEVIVGAGAVVVNDIQDSITVIGNPAKNIDR